MEKFETSKNSNERLISSENLAKWRDNTIEIAQIIGLDSEILQQIKNEVKLEIINDERPRELWYGYCNYDDKLVSVFENNLSTYSLSDIANVFIDAGIDVEYLETFNEMNSQKFREIFNQSGMDHEIIGHLYNHFAGNDHDESAAINAQIKMAHFRAIHDDNWKVVSDIMPEILKKHKKLDSPVD